MAALLFAFLALVAIRLGYYENWKVMKEPEIDYSLISLKAALRHHHCRHCKVDHEYLIQEY